MQTATKKFKQLQQKHNKKHLQRKKTSVLRARSTYTIAKSFWPEYKTCSFNKKKRYHKW